MAYKPYCQPNEPRPDPYQNPAAYTPEDNPPVPALGNPQPEHEEEVKARAEAEG